MSVLQLYYALTEFEKSQVRQQLISEDAAGLVAVDDLRYLLVQVGYTNKPNANGWTYGDEVVQEIETQLTKRGSIACEIVHPNLHADGALTLEDKLSRAQSVDPEFYCGLVTNVFTAFSRVYLEFLPSGPFGGAAAQQLQGGGFTLGMRALGKIEKPNSQPVRDLQVISFDVIANLETTVESPRVSGQPANDLGAAMLLANTYKESTVGDSDGHILSGHRSVRRVPKNWTPPKTPHFPACDGGDHCANHEVVFLETDACYMLYETVSEGTPISFDGITRFESPNALAEHLYAMKYFDHGRLSFSLNSYLKWVLRNVRG